MDPPQSTRSLLENFKPSRQVSTTGDSRARVASRRDPRLIAIRHAEILQHRKDVEAEILDSLLVLSLFPPKKPGQRNDNDGSSNPDKGGLVEKESEESGEDDKKPSTKYHHTASHPDAGDAAELKQRLRIFQPSDYDDLVEERNANNLCGYPLCPEPKPKRTAGGRFKLLNIGNARDFDIVDRREHETWCSHACRRRTFYIRLQLNETAAWERETMDDISIDLYDEVNDPGREKALEKKSKRTEEERIDEELAMERGDEPGKGLRVGITIRPKESKGPTTELSPDNFDSDSHLRLEGYKPKVQGA